MSNRHVPRRSGTGFRQVLPPARPKRKIRRVPARGPELCGAAHPDLDLTCTAEVRYKDDPKAETGIGGLFGRRKKRIRVDHRGKHRARPLVGIVVRWSADEVPS